MSNSFIEGIGSIELGVVDLAQSSKFLKDFGLVEKSVNTFSTLNGSTVVLTPKESNCIESITWVIDHIDLDQFYQIHKNTFLLQNRIDKDGTLECVDPSGYKIKFKPNFKENIEIAGASLNSWKNIQRIDSPVGKFDNARPIEIAHVVIETHDIEACVNFYTNLGFVVSDRIVDRGVFLRCNVKGGHHDLFLIDADKSRLNHIAFTVPDIFHLLAGGKSMSSNGWQTKYGPGRHNISSAFFWYFNSPLGAMFEYNSNEDYLTENWISRDVRFEKNLLSSESFV